MSEFICIPCPSGGLEFGSMPSSFVKSLGIDHTAIRLENGYPGPKGYGFLHVQGYSSRIKQVQQLGFSTFQHFAACVAQSYTSIKIGKKANRFQLCLNQPGYTYFIIVESANDRGYWTIVTGLPSRPDRGPALWERGVGGSELTPIAPEPRTRFTTLSLPIRPLEDDRS